jgi:metallo-beta-lactamase family protein
LTLLGGAGTVTGSKHLFEAGGTKLLVDCGMFQGHGQEELNRKPLPLDPSEIRFVLLTHAHIDHCGYLPRLVRDGFRGQVICTKATADIAAIMLRDAAEIQVEEAKFQTKRNKKKGLPPEEPLYTPQDVEDTLPLFKIRVDYNEPVELDGAGRVTFRDAGHILGSAFLEMELSEDGITKRIVASGDLGNFDKPIVRDPEAVQIDSPDYVLIESTYGSRNHRLMDESLDEFGAAVRKTLKRKGNVVIPSFALERAQDILYYLREFREGGTVPKSKVFLDSPLAISAVKIFKQHPECYDEEALELFRRHKDPFRFPGVEFTRTVKDSTKINLVEGGAIIIAASGMCQSGRIKHHLKHNLWKKECSVIFVGYQARGTLGRAIIEGKSPVNIYGEEVAVRSRLHTINGLSAHADRYGLLEWSKTVKGDPTFLVIHGEESESEALAKALKSKGRTAQIAALDGTLEL